MNKKIQDQYRFDEYGRYVKVVPNPQVRNLNSSSTLIRLHRIEKIVAHWQSINPDFRFHIKALSLCVVCFVAVFYPVIYFEDRQINMESKALIMREALDKRNYKNYLYQKFGLSYDIIEHYQAP